MKKAIISAMAAAVLLAMAGCGGFSDANVTVKYTGTASLDGTLDVYLAIAEGSALTQEKLDGLEIVDSTKITPSESEKTHVFIVPKFKSYTVFIFHDLNKNGEYDEGDTVRISSDLVSYLEDDDTVSISYNY